MQRRQPLRCRCAPCSSYATHPFVLCPAVPRPRAPPTNPPSRDLYLCSAPILASRLLCCRARALSRFAFAFASLGCALESEGLPPLPLSFLSSLLLSALLSFSPSLPPDPLSWTIPVRLSFFETNHAAARLLQRRQRFGTQRRERELNFQRKECTEQRIAGRRAGEAVAMTSNKQSGLQISCNSIPTRRRIGGGGGEW